MDQKSANTKKKKPKNTQNNSDKSLFRIADSLAKMESKYIFSDENEKGTEKKFWIPVRIAIISIFVNFILAIGTFLLWNQAIKQSKAAEAAADLAKQSIEIAQENFRIENGALLASSAPSLRFDNGIPRNCTISVTVTNFGKTVADSVSYWFDCIVSDKNIPYNPSIRKEFSRIPFFLLPLPNNGFPITDTINNKYIDPTGMRLKNERIKVFFYGEVRYKSLGRFDTLQFMSVSTSASGDFESYGTFNKLR